MRLSQEVEDEIVARYLKGESTLVLGRAYMKNKKTIRDILIRKGIPRRQNGERPLRSDSTFYQKDGSKLLQMVNEGLSLEEMGVVLGMASSRIHRYCVHFGIPLPTGKHKKIIPASAFSIPLSSEESWLLGLLLTDGSVNNNTLELNLTDKDAVEKAQKIIGFGSIVERQPVSSIWHGQHIQGRKPTWRYTACSMNLAERLAPFGMIPCKTKKLAFPDVEFVSMPDFIRGIWDGDGGWGINKHNGKLIANFGSASQNFMDSLLPVTSLITESKAKYCSRNNDTYWHIQYSGKGAVRLAKWLYYDNTVVCLERKKNIVTSFL